MGGYWSYLTGVPGPSGFGSRSTADEVTAGISLHAHTVIITGANAGIGFETARVLANRGARVVMACRNLKTAEDAKNSILKENPGAQLDILHLDLSSLASVQEFVREFTSLGLPLNILINNAGIACQSFQRSRDNIELSFATNHVGHFLLTTLLLDTMISTAKSSGIKGRIVIISSRLHVLSSGEFTMRKLIENKWYFGPVAYGDSKLANIHFSKELARRLEDRGEYVLVNALHPGVISTNISGKFSKLLEYVYALFPFFLKTVTQGAATTCYLAAHPDVVVSGKYFCDCNEATPSKHASNMKLAAATWNLSEKLTENFVCYQ